MLDQKHSVIKIMDEASSDDSFGLNFEKQE